MQALAKQRGCFLSVFAIEQRIRKCGRDSIECTDRFFCLRLKLLQVKCPISRKRLQRNSGDVDGLGKVLGKNRDGPLNGGFVKLWANILIVKELRERVGQILQRDLTLLDNLLNRRW